MKHFTKGDPDLWGRLDADQSDTDFVKTAEYGVDDVEFSSGPRIPPGFLIKHATVQVRAPVPPAADAPEWARREYDEQVKTAMLKLAGFWGEAFANLGKTLKGVLRGGSDVVETKAEDFMKLITKTDGGDISPKKLSKALKDLQAADPLDKTYRTAQTALFGAIPLMGLAGGAHLYSTEKLRRQHASVEHHLAQQPEFKNLADKEQAIGEAYGTMRKYSPTIAADPIVAKSFVTMLVQHPDQQNIEIIQNLMEAEKKYKESGEFTKDWYDISKLVRYPLISPILGGKGK
jgi:hypothetical protein